MASENKSAYVELDHYGSANSPQPSTKELIHKERREGEGEEEEAAVPDGSADESGYPSMWKLIPILVGLCCSVFCMALV